MHYFAGKHFFLYLLEFSYANLRSDTSYQIRYLLKKKGFNCSILEQIQTVVLHLCCHGIDQFLCNRSILWMSVNKCYGFNGE